MIQDVDSLYFEDESIKAHDAAFVYVWAGWSPECTTQLQIIENIANVIEDNLAILRIKAESNQQVLVRYKIIGFPTILYFSHGILIDRKVGLQTPEQILKQIGIITKLTKDEAASKELRGFFRWTL